MRILVLGGWPPSLLNFRGPLLRTLLSRGHTVIGAASAFERDAETEARLAELGVRFQALPFDRAGMNPARDLQALLAIRRFFERLQPDKVLCYTIKPVIYGSLAARMARVPDVFSIVTGLGYAFTGGSVAQRALNGLSRVLYRGALAGNRCVFFQNPDDLRLFRDLRLVEPAKAVLVNGSGVDLEHFAREPLSDGPVTFLLIARLLKDKGILEYAEAARRLKDCHPNLRFQLLGPVDPNPTAIRAEQVQTWVNEGVIEYLGEQRDVRPFLKKATVYVLPSYREGTPRTVLEAMATGRPVVTTDAPGCRETVVDGVNGLLVPVRDAAALATAMERFIVSPALIQEMGRQGRKLAEEKYDVHRVNEVILEAMGIGAAEGVNADSGARERLVS